MPRYIVIQIPDDLPDLSAQQAVSHPDCPVVLDCPSLTDLANETDRLDLANELGAAALRRREMKTRLDRFVNPHQGPHFPRLRYPDARFDDDRDGMPDHITGG